MKLIHKGGFRERANRNRKYQQSENHQTTLEIKHQYQPRITETEAQEDTDTTQQETSKSTLRNPQC